MTARADLQEIIKLYVEQQRKTPSGATHNSELTTKLDQLQFTAHLNNLLPNALPPTQHDVAVTSNFFLPTIPNVASMSSTSLDRLLRQDSTFDELKPIVSNGCASIGTSNGVPPLASRNNGTQVYTNAQPAQPHQATNQTNIPKSCSSDSLSTAEKRKMTHNEIEKRRRDRITETITSMCQYLPPGQLTGHHESKGVILQKLHDFLQNLVKENAELKSKLIESRSDALAPTPEIELLKRQNIELEEEKRCLTRILTETLAVCSSCDRCLSRHRMSPTSTSSNSPRNCHEELHQEHHGIKHHHTDLQPFELLHKKPKFELEDESKCI